MKKILVYFCILLTSASCMNAQKTGFTEESLKEKLLSSEDTQVAFKDIIKKNEGQTILIECWASWCSDCVKAMPKIKEVQNKNPEVKYVFLSMDKTAEKWRLGIAKHELKGDHYLATDGMKGTFAKAIDLDWIPRYIIIDKTGKIIVYKAIETDFELINSTLNSLK